MRQMRNRNTDRRKSIYHLYSYLSCGVVFLRASAKKKWVKIDFSTAPEDLEQLSKEDASEKIIKSTGRVIDR
jgi:hypothetical protein